MSDDTVNRQRRVETLRQSYRVQFRCVLCNNWADAVETGRGIWAVPHRPAPHGCRWWTRLGPITGLINGIRKRRGQPPSGGTQYRAKPVGRK